SVQIVY
nr:Chain A, Microtubule-associated protein tau [Homo sapiens]6ODG_B Chain B, Microtubule-associated protein tau [Homo sapiens]